ncbi:HNH endonuclease signature motif containing protein, partial [Cellulomonas humilata]|uniref:HNH endonuclease signature motif containing protein n=1 Tax=Cellulomonas humilata TaxID=144055 RepID=UPI001B3546BD
MSAEGRRLDGGRTGRLCRTAERRAAIGRDGQCTWSGCDQHASRCEVHHSRWWDRDKGGTSIGNAALLCKHHHTEVHRLNLSITRLEKPPG